MKIFREAVHHPDESLRLLHLELPTFEGGLHRHAHAELTWIERGQGLRWVGDSVEPFIDGDLVLVGGEVAHLWASRAKGEHVGTDGAGNKYYRARPKAAGPANGSYTSRDKRWVMYAGANDASRVPSEWHGWLHGTYDEVPESHLPPPKVWEVDYTPNATGTASAYRPQGALERGGQRARAVGDYEAWTPGGTDS
jgi:NADH:ubiquinone oxidoreductase subunit